MQLKPHVLVYNRYRAWSAVICITVLGIRRMRKSSSHGYKSETCVTVQFRAGYTSVNRMRWVEYLGSVRDIRHSITEYVCPTLPESSVRLLR